MQYRYYTFVAAQAISVLSVLYLVTAHAICLRGIRSSVEFHDALCTCKLGAAKYGERIGPANQLQRTSTLWTCAPLPPRHSKTVFHQPSRCSLRLQVHFRVDNFLLSGQNVTCTRGFVLQSDWYRQSKAPEVDNFSRGCYQALSSPRPPPPPPRF